MAINKRTTKDLVDELKRKRKSELYSIVKNLNTHASVNSFYKDGVDMELVLKYGVGLLLQNKLKIPTSGYFDLISFIE